jgi:hypothetical protein
METGKDIDSITWNPTGGAGWSMTAPSEAADVAWMNNTLKSRASPFTTQPARPPTMTTTARPRV